MRRFWIAMVLGLAACRASAADRPILAPPEAWVKPAPPTPIPTPTDAAVRWLLFDEQARFGPIGDAYYFESKVLAQTPQGLGSMGTVALTWNPDTESMTVHRVDIIRGDKVINLLANHDFTVIRREANLDMAVLDGMLTATLQVEGLQVGDVLDLAFTRARKDPVMAGRSEVLMGSLPNTPIERLRLRGTWSSPKIMRWRASDSIAAPKVTSTGDRTDVEVNLAEVAPISLPKAAPPRFQRGREIEFGEFASWPEVSALFAPLYDKAATLAPGSALEGEVAAIRAASADPKARAVAALALVQDKVRYLFLGVNDGGLAPADADTTWGRRFGDCKGKSVLLLALLKQLQIESQPVLVSSRLGDGMETRLPSVEAFDHMIVRARIGGEVYWLDGTRTGDRDLRDLTSAPFRWALPIQAPGSALVALPQLPLETPSMTIHMDFDASSGLDTPARVKGAAVLRGDGATGLRLALANGQPDDIDRGLRAFWKGLRASLEPKTVAAKFDPATGEERLTMDGEAKLDWDAAPGVAARQFSVIDANLGQKIDFKRDPGPHADAPFAVDHPTFVKMEESIVLPRGGAGFTIEGADIDSRAAGLHFLRKSRIDKGVFIVEASTRSLVGEFPAAEADAATKTLEELTGKTLYLRAPADLATPQADSAKTLAEEPTSASGFVDRGSARVDLGKYDEAIADFDKAVALDAKSAGAYAGRGIARFWETRRALAKADFDKAIALDPNNLVAFHGYGLLEFVQGNFARAAVWFTRAIDQKPTDVFALSERGNAWWALGDTENALADDAEVLRLDPASTGIRELRARMFLVRGETGLALAEMDAALAARPNDPDIHYMRARRFWAMGRAADARREVDAATGAKPTVDGYTARSAYRDRGDTQGKLADLDAALKLDPRSLFAWQARVLVFLGAKDGARALLEANRALALHPDDRELLLSRAQAFVILGQADRAARAFADIRAKATGDAEGLNSLCWAQATAGFALAAARADCDAALKIDPIGADALDSRALVELRSGQLDLAIADYGAALRLEPHLQTSLYGRGMIELKKGMKSQADADFAAANALDANVAADFAAYGGGP